MRFTVTNNSRFNKDSQVNNNSIRRHYYLTRINHPLFLRHNQYNQMKVRLKYLSQDHRPKAEEKKTKAQRGKSVVNLDADDDDDLEEIAHTRARKLWSKQEETILAEAWIEVSQDEDLGNDKENEFFWNQIHELFSERTTEAPRTKNMLSGKWSRMNADCQKFHVIYKHLEFVAVGSVV